MARKATEQVTTIGIDIGKNSLHLIGLEDCLGSIFRLSRCHRACPDLRATRKEKGEVGHWPRESLLSGADSP
jgi:hypothetical protein